MNDYELLTDEEIAEMNEWIDGQPEITDEDLDEWFQECEGRN